MNKAITRKKQLECFSILILIISAIIFRIRIGNIGVGLFFACLLFYETMWLIFGEKISDVLGRILRNKYSRGKNKEAKLIWKYSFLIQLFSGMIAAVILFVLGDKLFLSKLGMSHSYYVIWLFAVCIFIRLLSEAVAGYLCGKGAHGIAGFASVIRSICMFLLGFIFSSILSSYGQKVSALLKQEDFSSIYGCLGIAISLVIVELISLVYLLIFKLSVSKMGNDYDDDFYSKADSTGNVLFMLWRKRLMDVFVYVLILLPYIIGVINIFIKSKDQVASLDTIGMIISCILFPALLFVFVGYFLLLPTIAKTYTFKKKNQMRAARESFKTGYHICFIYGIFGLSFLVSVGPVLSQLFMAEGFEKLSGEIVFGGFFSILCLVSLFILKLMSLEGHSVFSLIVMGVSNVIYIVLINILSAKLNDIGRAVLICLLVMYIIMALLLTLYAVFKLDMSIDLIGNILVPILVGAVSGVVVLLLSKLLAPHLGNLFTTIFSFLLQAFIYVVLLLLSHNFVESELEYLPGSKLLKNLGQMFHVL